MAKLRSLGFQAELVPLKTSGDIDLVTPIYAMGVTGVFTKELDVAVLNHQADLAVHSLKDVPTVLPSGLVIAAVLERAASEDVLIYKPGFSPDPARDATIATSSIRRRSQWLKHYPGHTLVNVRGNIETRLQKFKSGEWDGIIFARAGLERLGLLSENFSSLDWMIPAPAQGAIAIICRQDDQDIYAACRSLNDESSERRVLSERSFLYHLEGGCSVPISALTRENGAMLHFVGAVHSLDGQREFTVDLQMNKTDWSFLGKAAADRVKASDKGKAILDEFRKLNRGQMPSGFADE
jgi:hydroxymethylbilane synthase